MSQIFPIADAHCDLLSYLITKSDAHFDKPEIHCSLPQLKAGNVKLQVLAIFTLTPDSQSSVQGLRQSAVFKELLAKATDRVYHVQEIESVESVWQNPKIGLITAIENASGFCAEGENFEKGLENLQKIQENVGKILYIGLTHHHENRFGGGNHTHIGLKDEGKRLLEHLAEQKIPVDLSHTSDRLAHDIFDWNAQNGSKLTIIASHSNFRHFNPHPRNLPDELAQELIKQKTIMGINWLSGYLGNEENLFRQFEYGMTQGAENILCMGADFFYDAPFADKMYFDRFNHASDYPALFGELQKRPFSNETLEKFASKNLIQFIQKRLIF